ncbi:MAG: Ribonuclease III [Candidatus Woesebacteria bacterium]|nr:MAG: Ribonuclease III [Candidatus Woesebacteria bacterium]
MNNSQDFQNLKRSFNNPKIIEEALTHRSWVNEHPGIRDNNERLEFLGDAILEFIVSKELFLQFPNKKEGFLTSLRANLVNTVSLSQTARDLGLGKELFLSKGEEETGGRENPSLLADTVEAIIGALFIDQGLEKAEEFIKTNILSKTQDMIRQPLKDAKSRLQEKVQSKGLPAPKYNVVKESGPDHQKTFVVRVAVNGKYIAEGSGKSKSEAEQKAAQEALKLL